MRQSLHGVLDPDVEVPEGRIRDAVLLVPATIHARLEDMSFAEPGYWLRDHSIEVDGRVITRKAGEKIGAAYASWRAARRQDPSLFYRCREGDESTWQLAGVRVWFQPRATEDGSIAVWLNDLSVEEGDRFTLSSTDCVSSEHSPEVRLRKWLNNSPQHTIGIRQTAKQQVTDIRFAKLGKDAAEALKPHRRRLHRERCKEADFAPTLESKHFDLMHLVIAMQEACVRDNLENRGVFSSCEKFSRFLIFESRECIGIRQLEIHQCWGVCEITRHDAFK